MSDFGFLRSSTIFFGYHHTVKRVWPDVPIGNSLESLIFLSVKFVVPGFSSVNLTLSSAGCCKRVSVKIVFGTPLYVICQYGFLHKTWLLLSRADCYNPLRNQWALSEFVEYLCFHAAVVLHQVVHPLASYVHELSPVIYVDLLRLLKQIACDYVSDNVIGFCHIKIRALLIRYSAWPNGTLKSQVYWVFRGTVMLLVYFSVEYWSRLDWVYYTRDMRSSAWWPG